MKHYLTITLIQMRVYQWVKNLLIFFPMFASRDFSHWETAILGFFSFSLLASSIYIINDICDLEADRQHNRKKNRPLASGQLSLKYAWCLFIVLCGSGTLLAFQTNQDFMIMIAVYLAVTTAYSAYLKKVAIADVIVLSGLYSLRLGAGAVITHVELSIWLVNFSIFLFTSLAFLKRYIELLSLERGEISEMKRGYAVRDKTMVSIFGIASGYLSILVFSLYLTSEQVKAMYSRPEFLWFVCVLLFFWISRTWMSANDKKTHDDPIVNALNDKASIVTGVLAFLTVYISV